MCLLIIIILVISISFFSLNGAISTDAIGPALPAIYTANISSPESDCVLLDSHRPCELYNSAYLAR